MRIFPVAQPIRQVPGDDEGLGKRRWLIASDPFGYRGIVGRGQREGLARKLAARFCADRPVTGAQFRQNAAVIRGVGNNGDGVVVFGGGADQRHATDIDVLDAILQARARRDCLSEGI